MKRFNEKYKKQANGCWIWHKITLTHKYGCFMLNGKNNQAHRASWLINVGPIPDGLKVLHKCDVPGCVNPDHLFLGTQKDNVRDCIKKGRFKYNSAKKGEGHHNSRLSETDVRNIRAIYKYTNATHDILSEIYSISRRNIGKIINRERWAHIC